MNYRDILKKKVNRRDRNYIGKISPADQQEPFRVVIGDKCTNNCFFCVYDRPRHKTSAEEINDQLASIYRQCIKVDWKPEVVGFSSRGETLFYLDFLKEASKTLRRFEKKKGIDTYYYIQTNGILLDVSVLNAFEKMEIDEVRVNLSASGYSPNVIAKLQKVKQKGFITTVEVPSWPLDREALFKLLPIFEKINLDHLVLAEMEVTPYNKKDIINEYPDVQIPKCVYDEGLAYDIMDEVEGNYSYSVLDQCLALM